MSSVPYPVLDWFPMIFHGDDRAEVNKSILTEIVFHPAELITEVELKRMTEASEMRTWGEVLEQLPQLEEAGLITILEDDQYTYYGMTDSGKQFLVDSQIYRGHEVMKTVYDSMIKDTEDFQNAYVAERPEHPPATDEYEEQEYDSDEWSRAREETYRDLTLSLTHEGDCDFVATLSTEEDGVVAKRFITVESVDWNIMSEHREMTVPEPRGQAGPPNAYDIIVEDDDGKNVNVKIAKGGEEWYQLVERCLYIFRD